MCGKRSPNSSFIAHELLIASIRKWWIGSVGWLIDKKRTICYQLQKGKWGLDQNFAQNIICFRDLHFLVIGWRWDEVQMYIRNSYLSSLSFAHFFFLSTTGVIVIQNGRFSGHVIKDFLTFEPNDLLRPPVDCMIKFQACCQSSPPLAIQMNYVYTSAWRSNYKAWLLL